MSKGRKHFADWLIADPQDPHYSIIRGTENEARFTGFRTGPRGISEYGTKKIDGVTCLKVSNDDFWILANLGWKLVHKAQFYSYVLPPEAKS